MRLRTGVGILVMLAAFLAYVATMAPGLTWLHDGADGGDLAAAVMVSGVPHPAGYPTYLLLAQVFASIPIRDVAYRLNLMSGACAAFSVGLVYLLVLHTCRSSVASTAVASISRAHLMIGKMWTCLQCCPVAVAASVALMFAFSPVFWSQAVITEVYALNALFVAALLLVALAVSRHKVLLCFIFGLALGNHLTTVLLIPTLVIMAGSGQMASPMQRKRSWANIAYPALALFAGLSVYLILPLRAAADPLVNWGQASTLSGFLWTISGGPYRAYAFGLPLADVPGRLAAWAALLIEQFGWVGVTLMLLGLWDMLTGGVKHAGGDRVAIADRIADTRCGWGLLLTFILYSVYALGYRTADSYLYMIPAYLVATLWLGRGLFIVVAVFMSWVRRQTLTLPREGTLVLMAGIALSLLPLAQLTGHWSTADASRDHSAQQYAEEALHSVPDGAIIITASDEHTFALWYQTVNSHRDVLVVDRDLTQFDWYRRQVQRRITESPAPSDAVQSAQYVVRMIKEVAARRAVYLADEDAVLLQTFRWQKDGLLWKLQWEEEDKQSSILESSGEWHGLCIG